jgi:hypothetical protein
MNTIVLISAGLLAILLFKWKQREGYSTDPTDTGLIRPVWYPNHPEPNYNTFRYEMRDLPWRVEPLGEPIYKSGIPYEMNKI